MKFPRISLRRSQRFYIIVFIMVILGMLSLVKFTEHYTSEVTSSNKETSRDFISVDDQSQRLNRIQHVCQNTNPKFHARNHITYDNRTNLAYCSLPKCGCTFWKQIYLLMSKMDENGNISDDSTLSMGRLSVHIKSPIVNNPNDKFLKKAINFIFVRDPYSRLWASYLDKLFLSDFWNRDDGGKSIVKRRKKTTQCAHDITFREFIEYVISNSKNGANEHWKPMVNLCDPCVLRPQFVGKIESFSSDRDSFLQSVGQHKVLNYYMNNQPDHSSSEISMLVKDYYRSYMNYRHKNCISQSDFTQRIWTLFKLNGHIPSNISFNPIIPRNESEMITYIHSVLKSAPRNKLMLKQQKKQAMIDAYKSLPKQYLEKLSQYYQDDFEMFGYDPKPKELFLYIPKEQSQI